MVKEFGSLCYVEIHEHVDVSVDASSILAMKLLKYVKF